MGTLHLFHVIMGYAVTMKVKKVSDCKPRRLTISLEFSLCHFSDITAAIVWGFSDTTLFFRQNQRYWNCCDYESELLLWKSKLTYCIDTVRVKNVTSLYENIQPTAGAGTVYRNY